MRTPRKYKREIPKNKEVKRKCLKCSKEFKANGKFVRVCCLCKNNENYNMDMTYGRTI